MPHTNAGHAPACRSGLSAAFDPVDEPPDLSALETLAAGHVDGDELELATVGGDDALPAMPPGAFAGPTTGYYVSTVAHADRNDFGKTAAAARRPLIDDHGCERHGEFDPVLFTVCPTCRVENARALAAAIAAKQPAKVEPSVMARLLRVLRR